MERLAHFPYSQSLTPVPAETANAVTHGMGWGLSVIAAAALMRVAVFEGDALTVLGCTIYTVSLVSLYAASTLSHSCEQPERKNLFRMLDQVCIFALIAGSYTPFALSHLRTSLGWSLLAAMWGMTLIGSAARVRLGDRPVSWVWYVALGWMPLVILGDVYTLTGLTGLTYVLAGGMAYMTGLWFFINDHKHPYYHAVWHCWVILGSGLHFLFHYRFSVA